ncbi:MAG: YceD family protein, partial [Candidatus Sumerlaeia bacterium]|nr:YceD family protein [Candidatus Sumerlaeia bacterium]
MRINVHELRKAPQEIEVDESPRDLQLAAEGFCFPGRVVGRLRFQMVGKRVLGNGHVETRVETACVRCLAAVEQTLHADIALIFEPRPPAGLSEDERLRQEWEADEQDIEFYDEDFLDPTDAVRQLLTLELPDYPLCRADCRGLCPQCGADRNLGGWTRWKAALRVLAGCPNVWVKISGLGMFDHRFTTQSIR